MPSSSNPSRPAVATGLLLAALALGAIPGSAQESAPPEDSAPATNAPAGPPTTAPGARPGGARWSLGVGVINSPQPYVGVGVNRMVVPMLGVDVGRFSFQGVRAGLTLLDRRAIRLDAVLGARFNGYDAGDSAFLAGMANRRKSLDGGLRLRWTHGRYGVEASAVSDLLGRSSGQEIAADVFYRFRFGYASLKPSVGLAWQSSALSDYYFGVRGDEATSGRPAYRAGAALSANLAAEAMIPITRSLALFGLARADRLADELVRSPIVGDRWALTTIAGVGWRF